MRAWAQSLLDLVAANVAGLDVDVSLGSPVGQSRMTAWMAIAELSLSSTVRQSM